MIAAHHLHGVSNDPLFCVIYCSSSFVCYEPVFFCTKDVLAIWLFSNMCIQSFKDLSIYHLLGRNDFLYNNVGILNRFESAALQFVGFCFHQNNKIADSLFAICSLQGFFIVLSQTSSNHLG
jgi:hypothetical protein